MDRVLLGLSRRFPRQRETALRKLHRANVLVVDYRADLEPRWGHSRPPHPQISALLEGGVQRYLDWVGRFAAYADRFAEISVAEQPADPQQPFWSNRMMSGIDAAAIYGFIAERKPATYIEVGSGNSTKFARRAIRDLGLSTRIVSIDPHPRAEIDEICDDVVRAPFETIDLARFEALEPNDVVLIDNSHRVLQNSDATVAFLDLLPILPAGVLIGIDDIFLPSDYPPEWKYRYYSEQYALATFLLGGHRGYDIELPAAYVTRGSVHASAIIDALRLPVGVEGNTFWMSRHTGAPVESALTP